MRISDWSSDVCSSDLLEPADFFEPPAIILGAGRPRSDNRIEPPPRALIDRHAAQARSQAPASDSVCMDQIIAVAHPDVHHDIPAARNRAVIGSLPRSEEHTSELQSLMRISYAVLCLKKKPTQH